MALLAEQSRLPYLALPGDTPPRDVSHGPEGPWSPAPAKVTIPNGAGGANGSPGTACRIGLTGRLPGASGADSGLGGEPGRGENPDWGRTRTGENPGLGGEQLMAPAARTRAGLPERCPVLATVGHAALAPSSPCLLRRGPPDRFPLTGPSLAGAISTPCPLTGRRVQGRPAHDGGTKVPAARLAAGGRPGCSWGGSRRRAFLWGRLAPPPLGLTVWPGWLAPPLLAQ